MTVASNGSRDAAQPLTSPKVNANTAAAHSNASKSMTSSSAASAIPLYDPASIILMDKQLARGYITLLSGKAAPPEQPAATSKKNSKGDQQQHVAEDAVTLGFVALTDGNVIEACFGIKQREKDNRAYKTVQKVKETLREASNVSDAIPQLAVEAYWNAFGIIVALHHDVERLNFVTRCWLYPGLVKKALDNVQATFAPLEEALRDST